MKKIITIALCLITCLCMIACDKDESIATFKKLNNDEVLCVGNNLFQNYDDGSVTTDDYFTYVKSRTYELNRSTIDYSYVDAIYYNGYYYYFSVNETTGNYLIGTKTVSLEYTYYYLESGNGWQITVKKEEKKHVEYSYEGTTEVTLPYTYTVDLNGYFANFALFKNTIPDLAEQVEMGTTKTHEIKNVKSRTTTSVQKSNYVGEHYYVEKNI